PTSSWNCAPRGRIGQESKIEFGDGFYGCSGIVEHEDEMVGPQVFGQRPNNSVTGGQCFRVHALHSNEAGVASQGVGGGLSPRSESGHQAQKRRKPRSRNRTQ